MGRKLASTVYLDGVPYHANTREADLPDGVAEKITHPRAWTDDDAGDPAETVAAGEALAAVGSMGQPVGPAGAPVIPPGTDAHRNLTDAADGPPAPPADQLDQLQQTGDPATTSTDPNGGAVPPPGAGQDVEPPPLSGRGSGDQAWREYAAARGVEVPADAKRDDVVAALRGAGQPVER